MKKIVDSLESVPEALRGLYSQTEDGKFKAAEVPGLYFEDDVAGLKKSQEALLTEKKKLVERYAGIDPDRARELEAEAQKSAEAKAKAEGRIEDLLAQHREKAKKEAELKDAAYRALEAELEDEFLGGRLVKAVTDAKGEPEGVLDAMRKRVRVEKGEDGRRRILVLREDGTPMAGEAGAATLSDLVAEFKLHKVWGRFFEGDMGAGSGARTGKAVGRLGKNPFSKKDWNVTEQMRLKRENPALADELQRLAGG